MGAKKRHHTRWLPQEWLKVAAHAVTLIERNGLAPFDALWAAQNELPEHRRQPRQTIERFASESVHGEIWRKNAAIVLSMSVADRDALLLRSVASPKAPKQVAPPPPPPPAPKPAAKPRNRIVEVPGSGGKRKIIRPEAPPYQVVAHSGSAVKWTQREWALIARAAKWVSEQYPQSKLWEQVFYAQQWTLDADRQRAMGGMRQSVDHGPTHMRLANRVAQGLQDGWLIENIPFVPPGSEPEAAAEPAEDLAAIAASVPEPVEAPPAAPSMPAATLAPPAVHSTIAEASKAFAETMLGALDKLLTTHSRVLLEEVNVRIAESSVRMGTQVAAMVQAGMQEAVHQMMQIELGGTITPPPAPPAVSPTADKPAESLGASEETEQRARLKVDVIGALNPIMRNQVRNQFTKGVDIRFFDGDHHTRYKPAEGRHVIFLSKRSTHGTFDKLKKFGVKPIYVEPSAGLINHAIEELQRSAHQ